MHGPAGWWPAETRFEILIGAVLTQNTAWSNVEKALAGLRECGWLAPETILDAPEAELAAAIRPSGYFNIKARRLRNLCRWFLEAGGFPALERLDTGSLREALLSVNGVGRETADDILVYAFERPVFVVDAYTWRIFERLGLIAERAGYEALRAGVEAAAPGADADFFNELHALLVIHGNRLCRPKPLCGACTLRDTCPAAS
ncbi:endonuclease [Salinisphaera sp. PC39]|uniref:endonuclease III domain-containing protein n=1 Tax=Salinisphaera sp. PC39 TaxID=1304156 RepID=UPI003341674D